jgi:hypothetical protein
MKKIYILSALLLASAPLSAQEVSEDQGKAMNGKNEIRLDALELIVAGNLEVDYEYIINQYSGAGIAVAVNLEDGYQSDDLRWAVTPFYRQYIFNKNGFPARGLFAEGSLSLGQYHHYNYDYNAETMTYYDLDRNTTRFGAGIALGYKFVSRSRFLLELSIAAGRFLGGDQYADDIYFRGGLLIGYRF